jgi:hypothetical protein
MINVLRLAEWERQGANAEKVKAELVGSARTIAARPNGYFAGAGLLDADTGTFAGKRQLAGSTRKSALPAQRSRITACAAEVLRTTEEIPWVATNSPARWALAAIQKLALVGDRIPS